jgi:hypothetical protein
MHVKESLGALVDITIVVIAYMAWRTNPELQWMFVGILSSMAGARVALLRKGPPGPPGASSSGGSLASTSAGMALILGIGFAAYEIVSQLVGHRTHAG